MLKQLNTLTLNIFAPLLILTGILGFVLPESLALTSGAAPYNIFHIVFGIIGLACFYSKQIKYIVLFNIGFGMIDLYQAWASIYDWFPASYFLWKPADDYLHLVIGIWLTLIGLLYFRKQCSRT